LCLPGDAKRLGRFHLRHPRKHSFDRLASRFLLGFARPRPGVLFHAKRVSYLLVNSKLFNDRISKHTECLLTAWLLWAFSVTAVLLSFFTSSLALRKAIRQTDERLIYIEAVGGWHNRLTSILNPVAGLLFLLGVIAIIIFIGGNVK
ncbi:MAG: hypothetical protein R6X19_08620, partial [Kiritimatiellia bacterium]